MLFEVAFAATPAGEHLLKHDIRWVVGQTSFSPQIMNWSPRSEAMSSRFFSISFASTLTANGNYWVIVTGLTTSGCVHAISVVSCSYGFIPSCAEADSHLGFPNR